MNLSSWPRSLSLAGLVLLGLPGTALTAAAGAGEESSPAFIRGDGNGDGLLSLADVFTAIRALHEPGVEPPCADAADFDDSGDLGPTDVIQLVDFVFFSAGFPPAPYPEAGLDPTPDLLGCSSESLGARADVIPDNVDPAADADLPQFPQDKPSSQLCDPANDLGQEIDFILFNRRFMEVYPGQRNLAVTVLLRNRNDLDGFTLSVHADPAAVWLEEMTHERTIVESLTPEWSLQFDRRLGDGYLAHSVLMDFAPPFEGRKLPRGCNTPVAQLHFSISPDATTGRLAKIMLRATPGDSPRHPSIVNEFSELGQASLPTLDALGLTLVLRRKETMFLRGDTTLDGKVRLEDVFHTLRVLFLGTPIDCLDRLDIDDNGEAEITDAIYLAEFLFLGGSAPRYPYPDPGTDPTPDPLGDCGDR